MSSTNIDYQITHYQGDTFTLQFNYLDETKTAVDLAGASAEMHIRRSPLATKLVGLITDAYPEGCFGISGSDDFEYGSGDSITGGTGGIRLNYNGVTGSIYITIDQETTSRIPARRNFYDLQITFNNTGEVRNILRGTFELARETTR